jgi:hypothetical protein
MFPKLKDSLASSLWIEEKRNPNKSHANNMALKTITTSNMIFNIFFRFQAP